MRKAAVLGAGRFGWSLAQYLTKFGAEVLLLDLNEDMINMADDTIAHAVCVDVTNETALKKLNLTTVDVAIVCIGDNIEASLLAATILQRIGVKEIWVRSVSEIQKQILRALDVDRILVIEEEMGRQVAHSLVNPGMNAFLSITAQHSVVEMSAKKPFIGKTLRDLDLRRRYGVNVVAIKSQKIEKKRDGEQRITEVINDLPGPDDVITADDTLILIGGEENLAKLQQL